MIAFFDYTVKFTLCGRIELSQIRNLRLVIITSYTSWKLKRNVHPYIGTRTSSHELMAIKRLIDIPRITTPAKAVKPIQLARSSASMDTQASADGLGNLIQVLKQPRVLSCAQCQKRKVKCDRCSPCSNCVKVRLGSSGNRMRLADASPRRRFSAHLVRRRRRGRDARRSRIFSSEWSDVKHCSRDMRQSSTDRRHLVRATMCQTIRPAPLLNPARRRRN